MGEAFDELFDGLAELTKGSQGNALHLGHGLECVLNGRVSRGTEFRVCLSCLRSVLRGHFDLSAVSGSLKAAAAAFSLVHIYSIVVFSLAGSPVTLLKDSAG